MRRRTIKKNIWLDYKEDRQLKRLSSLLNLSEANVIRKLLFETKIKEPPPKEFYNAIEKMNKIGININQLTRIANSTNKVYQEKLNKEFERLNELIELIKDAYT